MEIPPLYVAKLISHLKSSVYYVHSETDEPTSGAGRTSSGSVVGQL